MLIMQVKEDVTFYKQYSLQVQERERNKLVELIHSLERRKPSSKLAITSVSF